MDIQHFGIPQRRISSTKLFLKHGYLVQRYSWTWISSIKVFLNMGLQSKCIQRHGYPVQRYSETWIFTAKIFFKHGYSLHRYSLNMKIFSTKVFLKHGYPVQRYSEAKISRTNVFRNMDIQYKGIPQAWIFSTQIFRKHGYPVHIYSSSVYIQYKCIPKTWISSKKVFRSKDMQNNCI